MLHLETITLAKSRSRRALDLVLDSPFVLALQRLRYERRYRQWPGAFRGVYPDFAAAIAAAPSEMPLGYDSEEMASLYLDLHDRVWPTDYPTMLWLQKALPGIRKLFDLGGHLGISFYGFSRYLAFPASLRWLVCDVPAVVEKGRELARTRGAERLEFTTRQEECDGAEVLHASGSLQYLEAPLEALLDRLARPPGHLFLNKLPLHDGPAFVTLQHTVHAYSPYRVFNREQFIAGFTTRGYELVDSWDDRERSCVVPYFPGHAVGRYTGLYLRRRSSAT